MRGGSRQPTPPPGAVGTGAGCGVGRGLARGLGARGYALVLVSERPEALAAVAAEIFAAHGTVVHTLVSDLARPEAAGELHAGLPSLVIAFGIKRHSSGSYANIIVNSTPAVIAALQTNCAHNDDVFRVLFTASPEPKTAT